MRDECYVRIKQLTNTLKTSIIFGSHCSKHGIDRNTIEVSLCIWEDRRNYAFKVGKAQRAIQESE